MKMFKKGARPSGRALLGAVALLAATVTAGCGGGSRVESFSPTGIVALGDESSVITSEYKKYTVSALNSTTGDVACASNPLWIQSLASAFGLVFAECNTSSVAVPGGKIYAAAEAKAEDLEGQIDKYLSVGSINSKTLFTVLIGSNDVLELYAEFPQQSRATLLAEAAARGKIVAQQVNRLANADGRIILVTVPDLGKSPFAIDENNTKFDTDRAQLLTDLVSAFNTEMRLDIVNDGRLIGLVLADEMVQSIAKYPSSYGYTNVVDPACLDDYQPPECTTATLTSGASDSTWLWATTTLLSPGGHSRLGTLAKTRATNNPF